MSTPEKNEDAFLSSMSFAHKRNFDSLCCDECEKFELPPAIASAVASHSFSPSMIPQQHREMLRRFEGNGNIKFPVKECILYRLTLPAVEKDSDSIISMVGRHTPIVERFDSEYHRLVCLFISPNNEANKKNHKRRRKVYSDEYVLNSTKVSTGELKILGNAPGTIVGSVEEVKRRSTLHSWRTGCPNKMWVLPTKKWRIENDLKNEEDPELLGYIHVQSRTKNCTQEKEENAKSEDMMLFTFKLKFAEQPSIESADHMIPSWIRTVTTVISQTLSNHSVIEKKDHLKSNEQSSSLGFLPVDTHNVKLTNEMDSLLENVYDEKKS